MANLKISELTAAGALDGSELVEIVQSGTNKQTTTQDIADLGGGGPGGAVDSVNGQTGVVVLEAEDIAFTPAGNIGSTEVQSALQELDVEIDSRITAALAGLKWKTSVRVATTVAGTLASDFENGDSVDGVTLATGNRILLKNQSDQTQNGIYTVNASGAPTRSTDADAAAELESAAVTVDEGTTNANTTWLQITDSITLGVSNIVWTQYGSSVPDADATTKGIARLYPSTSLGSNVDGAPTQNAAKVYADNQDLLKVSLVNSAVALVDGATIDLTAIKHTLTTSSSRTFTISYTGDDITIELTLSATSATQTFPVTALCVSDGLASGDNTLPIAGVSGDKYIIAIKKIGSAYYVVSKNFGQ